MSDALPCPAYIIDTIRALQDEYKQHDFNLESIMSPSKPFSGGGTSRKALKRRKAEHAPPSSLLACIKSRFESSDCLFGSSDARDASGTIFSSDDLLPASGVADAVDSAASACAETETTCKVYGMHDDVRVCLTFAGYRAKLF